MLVHTLAAPLDHVQHNPREGKIHSMPAHSLEARRAADLHYLKARRKREPHYEYRTVVVPRGTSKTQTRALLVQEAEVGKWELARTVIYEGGTTKYWLRRRIIAVGV